MEVSMSDVYQDDDFSTYDSEPEPSIVQGTLEGWAHLANCKGYAKLFFGKPAERPQAGCVENTKPIRCASHVLLKIIVACLRATITNTGFGETKMKSLDTKPALHCRHQLACASHPSFFNNASIFRNNCYVGLSTTSLPN